MPSSHSTPSPVPDAIGRPTPTICRQSCLNGAGSLLLFSRGSPVLKPKAHQHREARNICVTSKRLNRKEPGTARRQRRIRRPPRFFVRFRPPPPAPPPPPPPPPPPQPR